MTNGGINVTILNENDTLLHAPYNRLLPIESLWDRVQTAVSVAEDGNVPYTNEQLLTIVRGIVKGAGIFQEACCEWRRKSAMDKMWPNFKKHFNSAYAKQVWQA